MARIASPRASLQGRRVALIGGFSLQHRRAIVALPLGVQRLVAFLALKPKAVLRVYVAGVLWPETSESQATANLRTMLWRLRQADVDLVAATSTQLALVDNVDVDVREASGVARRVLAQPRAAAAADLDALPLAGELLPDWYDEWLLVERERFRQLRLHALEALCEGFVSQGAYSHALEAGLAAVELDPLRESPHRALMRVHSAEGNVSEAARELEGFCTLLRTTLGVAPSEQMRNVAIELRIPWRYGDA